MTALLCSREKLLGPSEGWSLAPIAEWLLTEGQRAHSAEALVAGLTERLLILGLPLDRLRVSVETLHPQLIAWSVSWFKETGTSLFLAPHSIGLRPDFKGSPIEHIRAGGAEIRYRPALGLLEHNQPNFFDDLVQEQISDYIALPMVFSNGTRNFVSFGSRAAEGFSDADLAKLRALVLFLTPLFETLELRFLSKTLLETYVGPRTADKVLAGSIKRGDSEVIQAAIWYSDLRNFTGLTESLPAAKLIELLNEYCEHVAAAASPRGGEILQFIGDAILIVFAADGENSLRIAANNAVDAAIDAFNGLAVVNHRRQRRQEPPIRFGVGLHVGTVTHGNIGSPSRLAFNVVGGAVNRAARLEAQTKDFDTPLLFSSDLAALLSQPSRKLGDVPMRGLAGLHTVHTLEPPIEI
ncbi:adenylate/guanylate cyclase domain-containing protein [Elstera litoralis]|uniref:adenylate/guanylate cyclase domain-containing protein n=1 Tax=Elstera litoralis TaxID=552518 RepID=UPI0006978103|nr:adenylate/guanylate cyclase domain-containing protein [Elstera litoralis]